MGQASEPAALEELGPPELTEEEFRLLDRFLSRISELTEEAQNRMTWDLARRFETRVVRRTADPQAYLVQLFTEERAKRRGRFGTRARPGEPGRVAVTAERFVERKRESWEAFRDVATRIERPGVRALPAAEIPAFAARYREVAADLARAQTYGVDPHAHRVSGASHRRRAQRALPVSTSGPGPRGAGGARRLPRGGGDVVAVRAGGLSLLHDSGGGRLHRDPASARTWRTRSSTRSW